MTDGDNYDHLHPAAFSALFVKMTALQALDIGMHCNRLRLTERLRISYDGTDQIGSSCQGFAVRSDLEAEPDWCCIPKLNLWSLKLLRLENVTGEDLAFILPQTPKLEYFALRVFGIPSRSISMSTVADSALIGLASCPNLEELFLQGASNAGSMHISSEAVEAFCSACKQLKRLILVDFTE